MQQQSVDSYAEQFGAEHKDIVIKPVFAGSYDDTIAKAVTAFKAGNAPPLAMLGAIQVYALIDMEAIVPFDEVATSAEDKAWLKSFFPAFLANGNVQGHTWSVPFQRSTVVLFWNKKLFQEAGLDPEKPPQNCASCMKRMLSCWRLCKTCLITVAITQPQGTKPAPPSQKLKEKNHA